jgi:hypothetical protein
MKTTTTTLFALLALAVITSSPAAGDNGTGKIGFGYVFVDEDGSRAVNSQTFNTYEGVALSMYDWRYNWENGTSLKANLKNITLNNRDLRLWLGKPGRFSLSATNNQYRRVYSDSASNYTRRRSTNVQAMFQASRYFKVFGGYGRTDKHGTDFFILPAINDTINRSTDYGYKSYNFGTQMGDRYGLVRAEYRRFDFTDNTGLSTDRKAEQVDLYTSSTVPSVKWLYLAGGLNLRKDKVESTGTDLKTNQWWGGAKAYLTPTLLLDYRLVFATTKRNSPQRTIDNLQNVISLGKTWSRRGGVRVGYENRISDDFVNRTSSDGLLANAWLRPNMHWYFEAAISTRKADVTDGVTLLGDESRTNHAVSALYSDDKWGSLGARWEGHIRTNDDINSRTEYNVLSGELNLIDAKKGRLTVTHSYYVRTFENRSDNTSYEFADHVLTGHAYLTEIKQLTVDFGGTWYRSKRDQDMEKLSGDIGVAYRIQPTLQLAGRYRVYNFDNFLVTDEYYTANIVEFKLIKDVQF